MRAWPAVVVAMGGFANRSEGVALLSVLGLGGAALVPHGAAQSHSGPHEQLINSILQGIVIRGTAGHLAKRQDRCTWT